MGKLAQKGGRLANAARKLGPVEWEALALACLLSWYGLACHVSVEPEFSLPVWFLSHPRRDLSWLVFLLTAAAAWGVAWAAMLAGGHQRSHRLWAALEQRAAVCVAGAVMAAGTALVTFGSASS